MKILGIDTSGENCSACIIDEEKVIADFNVSVNTTHSENLVPMIEQITKFSKIDIDDIDVFACSIGPGSFTGLRIGLATVKGMALSLNKPVIGVSSLMGLAYNISNFDGFTCPIIDAKNNNIYSGIFEYTNNKPELIDSLFTCTLDELIEKLLKLNKKIIFVGDGAVAYRDDLTKKLNDNAVFAPSHLNNQLSTSIAKVAMNKALLNEYDDYNSIIPLYLKKSQAERMLDSDESNSNQ